MSDRQSARESAGQAGREAGGKAEPLGQRLLEPFAALRTARPGLAALGMNAAVALAVIFFARLIPPTDWTRRGQVYFAVFVGFMAATFVTRRTLQTTDPVCYWPAPLLLGIVGLIVAGLRPALMLPDAYASRDTIPAWALARPLPVEMVGVGLVGALWLLRGRGAPAGSETRSTQARSEPRGARSTQSQSEKR